jgi:hypothetical protein
MNLEILEENFNTVMRTLPSLSNETLAIVSKAMDAIVNLREFYNFDRPQLKMKA